MTTETTTYSTTVVSPNSWHVDGSAIIERDCGHRHRTLAAAQACLDKLSKRHPDGMYSAAWFRAAVRRSDGSPLTEGESDALHEIVWS